MEKSKRCPALLSRSHFPRTHTHTHCVLLNFHRNDEVFVFALCAPSKNSRKGMWIHVASPVLSLASLFLPDIFQYRWTLKISFAVTNSYPASTTLRVFFSRYCVSAANHGIILFEILMRKRLKVRENERSQAWGRERASEWECIKNISS